MVQADSKLVRIHDLFNLGVLVAIVTIDLTYLYKATEWAEIWTPTMLGAEQNDLFVIFYVVFLSYLIIDSIWIFLFPQSVISNPDGILFHHVVCILLTMVPWLYRQYAWYMVFALSSEINTFLTILRRQLVIGTIAHSICNVLFYVTWVTLRLLLFPLLCYLYTKEYLAISKEIGSHFNFTILAPICQIVITFLNWKWTFDLLKKSWKKKE
jgi:hypothetical protein